MAVATCRVCNNGFILSLNSASCCTANCNDCSSATQCTSCVSGSVASVDGKTCCTPNCAACNSDATCTTCALGYFLSTDMKTCSACASGCRTCTSGILHYITLPATIYKVIIYYIRFMHFIIFFFLINSNGLHSMHAFILLGVSHFMHCMCE